MPLRAMFIDLNSFFASCEQQLNPSLRGKPVAVVPVETDTTSVIAASYQAKKFGVRTGTRVGEAKRMCPGLICVSGGHGRYIEFHHKILEVAATVLPVHDVHSIDEFSCRLIGDERRPERAVQLARDMKRAITTRVGECLTCSVGLAGNRFLAKIGTDMQKPDGLVVLDDHDLPGKLLPLTLRDLPGVGPRMEKRLHRGGVYTVEQLLACDEKRMVELWESINGSFYYHALRGEDMAERPTVRRTIGHQHVLSPEKRNLEDARAVLIRLLDKAAARARAGDPSGDDDAKAAPRRPFYARRLSISVRYTSDKPEGVRTRSGWHASDWGASATFAECNDTATLLHEMIRLWKGVPKTGTILLVGVTLSDLTSGDGVTHALFDDARKRARLSTAIDRINNKIGKAAVYPASMHSARKSAPARIAFSNIPDMDLPHVKESAKADQDRAGS